MLGARIEETGVDFFMARIGAALAHRERFVHKTEAYRLVYAEADSLPALIVDRYSDWLVVQTLNQGMDKALPLVVKALEELLQPAGILARNDASVRTQEQLPREVKVLAGDIPETVDIRMNGLKMRADLMRGMKTGVFLDQRENYLAAARYAKGNALDCFSSTGGFALHLARVCERVEAVDSSEPALSTADKNAAANSISNIVFREADVFDALAGYATGRRVFDTIVLDPPAFAKSRVHRESALRAYKEINRRALTLLAPGGILITCSCSHHVSEADLLGVIAEGSLEVRRPVRILERRAQAQDHPVLLTVPETLYLKCLVLQAI
jgi:23S rRNA (cytosine1962-C5)-methyltransferase